MLTGVIFCDSDNFIAKEIKAITRDDVSHVALVFGETVLHFRFLGFESMHIAEFEGIYKVSHRVLPPVAIMVSESAVIKKYRGRAYDFFGVIYVGLFILVRDLFGIHLPGGNRWEKKRDMFCVEFAADVCGVPQSNMMTPAQLLRALVDRGWKYA